MTLQVTLVAGINPSVTRSGGIRTYVLGLCRYLASTGTDVTLLGIGSSPESQPFKFIAATSESQTTSLVFQHSLRKFLRDHDFSDAIIHAQRPDDLVPFLANENDIRSVVTIHGDPLPGIRSRHGRIASLIYRKLERKGVCAAERLLFVDPQSREVFSRRYPAVASRFMDTAVGIDLNVFRASDPERARRDRDLNRRPYVLFAGRFESEKNLGFLARAISLCETRPTLLLAGGKSGDAALRQVFDGVAHRFLGIVSHDRMNSLFSAVDATVLPSMREAMPTVCLESLACGVPVVATPVGRIPELIKSGTNGFVVEGGPSAFAQAIDLAIHSSGSMRQTCRESVRRFGWDTVGPALVQVYREVIP